MRWELEKKVEMQEGLRGLHSGPGEFFQTLVGKWKQHLFCIPCSVLP